MCVVIYRKPENGPKIQKLACWKIEIILHIKLIKEKAHNEVDCQDHDSNGILHGTNILKELMKTWARKGDIIVYTYSYFTSVESALEMKHLGLHFIGVVKMEHKQFTIKKISYYEFTVWGQTKGTGKMKNIAML